MKSKLRLFEITSKKRWLNIKNRVLDHPDFHPTLSIPAPPSPPAPPARILSFLFSLVSNKVGSPPHALQPPWAGHDELSQSTLSISAFKVGVPPLSVLLSTTILLHPQFSDTRRDPTRAPWAAPWPRWAGPPSLHHCRIFTRSPRSSCSSSSLLWVMGKVLFTFPGTKYSSIWNWSTLPYSVDPSNHHHHCFVRLEFSR